MVRILIASRHAFVDASWLMGIASRSPSIRM
jgi:hypothetical protein